MNTLKNGLKFYINSNLHVAFAGYCITKLTLLEFGLYGRLTPVFVALSIIISYNFIRYMEIKTARLFWFRNWFESNKIYLFILAISALVALVDLMFLTNFNKTSVIVLIPFALITFFYAVPIGRINNLSFSFRNFPAIKIFSIAFSWAGITVFFPLVEKGIQINSTVYIEFVQRFLVFIALAIPFDIRDIESDSKNLKTIPQVFGITNSKIIGYILLLIFVLLEFFKINFSKNHILILLLVALISSIFLAFTSVKQTRFYTGFWVEAIPIFWLIIYSVILKFNFI